MDANDISALRLAIQTIRDGGDRGRIEQIEEKLEEEGFERGGAFAASICQSRSLGLRPWDEPKAALEARAK